MKKIDKYLIWCWWLGIAWLPSAKVYGQQQQQKPEILLPNATITTQKLCVDELAEQISIATPSTPNFEYSTTFIKWERYASRSASSTLIGEKSDNKISNWSYKNLGKGNWIRYHIGYKTNEFGTLTSSWSPWIQETTNLYKATAPVDLETYALDKEGNTVETNLVCRGQPIKLVANMPSESEGNHIFHWYRNGTHIGSTNANNYIDNDSKSDRSRELVYRVKTELNKCSGTYSGMVYATTTYQFKGAASSVDYTATPASCPGLQDGVVNIRSVTGSTNYVYYILSKIDENGEYIATETSSSPRVKKNEEIEFSDLDEGRYILQVLNGGDTEGGESDESGYCYSEFSIDITALKKIDIDENYSLAPVSCHDGNDGSLSIGFSQKQGDIQLTLRRSDKSDFSNLETMVEGEDYYWSVESNTLKIDSLRYGHYQVWINDVRKEGTVTCAADPESVQFSITQPADLDFSTVVSDYNRATISCRNAADAFIEVTATGGNQTNIYSAELYKNNALHSKIENFTTATSFTNLDPGAYTVTVKAEGCYGIEKQLDTPIIITQPDYLVIDSIRTNPITCHGVPNGQITVSSQGGTGTRQFIIDGDTSLIQANVSQEVTLTDLDSGWHTVEVVDINGCVAPEPFSFHLQYPTPFSYELDSIMPLCHGGSDGKLFIRPFGGDTITQDYTVTIRSIVSAKYPKLVERISGTYTSTMPPIEFNELLSAYYEITVTDASTQPYVCSKVVDTVFLPQPDLIALDTVQVTLPSCAGASDGAVHLKATKGTPGTTPDYYYSIDGVTYVAPNEMGIAIFTDIEAGNHTFYAIDAHHAEYLEGYDTLTIDPTLSLCVGTFNFTLKEPEFITVYPTMRPVTCYGTATGSITVDSIAGGWGIYTYEWSILDPTANTPDGYRTLTPADPANLSDVPCGSYRLIVRDTAGCASTTTIEVTQPEIPLIISAVQQYPESCAGTADGKLEIRAEGGYPPYTYQIDGGAYQASGFFDGLTAGPYMLSVRDQKGCEVQQMANLAADDITVVVTDQLPATVDFQDGLIRLHVTGGQNKNYYLDGTLSTTGAEFSGLAAGEHTVAITYNEKCRWEQTYTIEEVAAPVPALRVITQSLQNVRCSKASDGSISVSITGGIAPYTLQWDDPQQQTSSEATGLAKGTHTLTVTDAAGVVLDYPVIIDGPELFEVINTVAASPACYQGADGYAEVTVIGGTAPYTYSWNDDEQQTAPRASALTAGTYMVTVTDQNGCTLTQELTVKPTPAPDDVLEPQAITLCTGQSVTVDAGLEGSTYQWTADNGFNSEAQSITIDQAGRYFLQVITPQGCTAYDTLDLVTTQNLIDAEFLLPSEIAAGDTVVLTEVSWPAPEQTVWLYDENITTHQSEGEKEYVVFPESGEYTIKLVVMVGDCTDEVEKKIIVSDRAPTASVPNGRLGYSPKNEYLIYPNPSHGKFTLKISMSQTQRVRVSVYDPLFKYRYQQQTFTDTQSLEEKIDLTHLKHGVYHLMIETNDEIKILRFVIR